MQFFGQGKPPVGVVFDTDMGNGIDDALALALLYGLDGKNEARVAAIAVSKPNLNAAALCDVIRVATLGSPSRMEPPTGPGGSSSRTSPGAAGRSSGAVPRCLSASP